MSQDNSPPYDPDEVRQLFFQMDNMLHTRVNALLVAEAIFFAAAAAVWQNICLTVPLCLVGVVVTLLFTFTNVKLYWRVTWLLFEMKRHSELYRDYIKMKGIRSMDPPIARWPLARWLLATVRPESQDEAGEPRTQWRPLDTGWLYTWGLCFIALAGWTALLVASLVFNVVNAFGE